MKIATNISDAPSLVQTGVSRYLVAPGESVDVSDRAAERLDSDPDFHISESGSDHPPAAGSTPDLDDAGSVDPDDFDPDGVNELTA